MRIDDLTRPFFADPCRDDRHEAGQNDEIGIRRNGFVKGFHPLLAGTAASRTTNGMPCLAARSTAPHGRSAINSTIS